MRPTHDIPTTAKLRTLRALALPADPVTKVPVRWNQDIGRLLYWFELDYNAMMRGFVLAIGIAERELLRTKLVYGQDVMAPFQHIAGISGLSIVPMDLGMTQAQTGITSDNIGSQVQLLYYYEAP